MTVIEPVPGDWQVLHSTHPYEKLEAHTLRFSDPGAEGRGRQARVPGPAPLLIPRIPGFPNETPNGPGSPVVYPADGGDRGGIEGAYSAADWLRDVPSAPGVRRSASPAECSQQNPPPNGSGGLQHRTRPRPTITMKAAQGSQDVVRLGGRGSSRALSARAAWLFASVASIVARVIAVWFWIPFRIVTTVIPPSREPAVPLAGTWQRRRAAAVPTGSAVEPRG